MVDGAVLFRERAAGAVTEVVESAAGAVVEVVESAAAKSRQLQLNTTRKFSQCTNKKYTMYI